MGTAVIALSALVGSALGMSIGAAFGLLVLPF